MLLAYCMYTLNFTGLNQVLLGLVSLGASYLGAGLDY